MGKQAIGIPLLNYNTRFDTTAHVLYYPQRPLVCTRMHEIIGTTKMPAGQVPIVAVVEHTGYNQEDSIILNQAWVDRGGGRSSLYKTYKADTKKHKILPDDKFEKPNRDETMSMKKGNYEKLEDDGIVSIGERVTKGDIIVGITGPSPTFSSFSRTRSYNKAGTQRVATNINPKLTKQDRSISIRIDGQVDKVLLTENSEQTTMVKLRCRTERIPKVGDKFAASSGQKGTVGLTLKPQDMPYCVKDGIIPDIMMNPHAFPSRMTINQQIEMLFGKLCALNMTHGDSTPFSQANDTKEGSIVDSISARLEKFGYQPQGEEIMINPTTGRKLKVRIFMGPAYYQRLKHMVDDKKHSRSKGPLNQLTRQPVEGRMRDGGLRVGEMEKDTLVAHGVAMNINEMMMKKSDKFTVPFCNLCGLIGETKPDRNVNNCRHCDNMDHVYNVNMPYAAKLTFQELMSMLIRPSVELGSLYENQ
jgi:DNA-directed RNA polymerase II subunit RPB2